MDIIKKLQENAKDVYNAARSYENGACEKFEGKRPHGIEVINYVSKTSKENIKQLYLNVKITKFLTNLLIDKCSNDCFEVNEKELKRELERQIITDEEKEEILNKLLKSQN